MDLGKKQSDMYDAPTSPKEDKKYYPSVTLPLALIQGKNFKIKDKISLDFTGTIVSITQDEYGQDFRVELEDGEAESPKEEKSEEK